MLCIGASLNSVLLTDYQQQHSLDGNFTCIAADPNGIIIGADARGIIYAWSAAGALLHNQSYSQYGSVTLIDASNVLDVFVYYRTSRKLIVLDNQLNFKKELDFNLYQNFQVQGLGRASDGMCWILDSRERVLRKINFEGRTIQTQMMQGRGFPKHFCRIQDNGSSIVVASDADTLAHVYSSSLLPLRTIVKPARPWSFFSQYIYTSMDSAHVLATSVNNGFTDTMNVSGSTALHQIAVFSRGMANRNRGKITIYKQLP